MSRFFKSPLEIEVLLAVLLLGFALGYFSHGQPLFPLQLGTAPEKPFVWDYYTNLNTKVGLHYIGRKDALEFDLMVTDGNELDSSKNFTVLINATKHDFEKDGKFRFTFPGGGRRHLLKITNHTIDGGSKTICVATVEFDRDNNLTWIEAQPL